MFAPPPEYYEAQPQKQQQQKPPRPQSAHTAANDANASSSSGSGDGSPGFLTIMVIDVRSSSLLNRETRKGTFPANLLEFLTYLW